jgi:hypothetical protein
MEHINTLCEEGYIKGLDEWYLKGNLVYDEYSLAYASSGGHIDVLDWWYIKSKDLQEKSIKFGLKFKYDENAVNWASSCGHLGVLKWWYSKSIKSGLEFKYEINYIKTFAHDNCKEWFEQKGFFPKTQIDTIIQSYNKENYVKIIDLFN